MERKILIRVKKWQFLVGLAVCMAGILFLSENTYRSAGASIKVAPIRAPAVGALPKVERNRGGPVLRAFERWMDSLRNDEQGRSVYDSIQQIRPGLLDSVRKLNRNDYP